MSGNLGGFRSSGLSTAVRGHLASVANAAGFEALLTFPGSELSLNELAHTGGQRCGGIGDGRNKSGLQRSAGNEND
jgi:hypothetical protein